MELNDRRKLCSESLSGVPETKRIIPLILRLHINRLPIAPISQKLRRLQTPFRLLVGVLHDLRPEVGELLFADAFSRGLGQSFRAAAGVAGLAGLPPGFFGRLMQPCSDGSSAAAILVLAVTAKDVRRALILMLVARTLPAETTLMCRAALEPGTLRA
jgi:hypothetical protein